jgi:hypothetical protein
MTILGQMNNNGGDEDFYLEGETIGIEYWHKKYP